MNIHAKIIAALLFMVACTPLDAQADEQSHCLSNCQVQRETNRLQICHSRHKKTRNQPLNPVININDECDRKLLEELVKNATECLKDLDLQADILEKLLLESTPNPYFKVNRVMLF